MTTTLDSSRLAGVFDANETAITANPSAASLTFTVRGTGVGTVATDIRARTHQFFVDEPGQLGGEDSDANPVEYALGALAACQVVTYRLWAAKLDVELTDIEIAVAGDLDVQGFFGTDADVRPGFGDVRLEVTLHGPDAAALSELSRTVDEHCPVLDLFRNPTPVRTSVVTR